MFLVGKEIPEEILTLPQKFLDTPFGQMMKPQIDQALRRVTQAPVMEKAPTASSASKPTTRPGAPAAASGGMNGHASKLVNGASSASPSYPRAVVHNATSLKQVKDLLESAKASCAVIFFTSSTCAPCKIVYPAYDELAQEADSRAVLIKVDINQAYDVAQAYQVRATPTFKTFCRGKEDNTWLGANEAQLRSNVRMLLDMTYPPHPHTRLRLPNFQVDKQPVIYKKIPPLDKLAAKLAPAVESPPLSSLLSFNKARFATSTPAASHPLPSDLNNLPSFISTTIPSIPRTNQFALIDLLRVSFIDPRVSGFFAAEDPAHSALLSLLTPITSLIDNNPSDIDYKQLLTALQLLCNLFTSPVYAPSILSQPSPLHEPIITLTTFSLQHENPTIVHTAAALAFNLTVSLHNARFQAQQNPESPPPNTPQLEPDGQISLIAALLESLQTLSQASPSTSGSATGTSQKDVLQALLLALGLLIYGADVDGEVLDLCKAMGAKDLVEEIRNREDVAKDKSVGAVAGEVVAMLK